VEILATGVEVTVPSSQVGLLDGVQAVPFVVLREEGTIMGWRSLPGFGIPPLHTVSTHETGAEPVSSDPAEIRRRVTAIVDGIRRRAAGVMWGAVLDAVEARGMYVDLQELDAAPFDLVFKPGDPYACSKSPPRGSQGRDSIPGLSP
jgi:hypothetical protein